MGFVSSSGFAISLTLFTLVSTILSTDCRAEQKAVLKSKDLQQQASWLNDLHDYQFNSVLMIETEGVTINLNPQYKAMVPNFFSHSFSIFGVGKHFLCNGDSLWISMPNTSNYSVKAVKSVPKWDYDEDIFLKFPITPPFPFDLLSLLGAPELDSEYELTGEGDLELNGKPHRCEIWSVVGEPENNLADSLWIDPERHIILKMVGEADLGLKGLAKMEFRFTSLTVNAGLTPEDFKFIPEVGYKRVSTPEKLLVGNSLEGKTPASVQLKSLAGVPFNTADWRGKVVVLDFWATWCSPCKESLPHLRQLQVEFKDEILVVGVTDESADKVEKFFKNNPSPYPIFLDEEKIALEEYGISNLPTLFVLNSEGKVLEHFVGYQPLETLRTAVKGALGVSELTHTGD